MEPGRNETTVEPLAERADLVRSKLLLTLGALDKRGREMFDVRLQVKRHIVPLSILGAVVVGGTAVILALRSATAERRRRRARWSLLKGVWRHPERVAVASEDPILLRIGKSTAVGAVTTLLSHVLKEALQKGFDRRRVSVATAPQPASTRATT